MAEQYFIMHLLFDPCIAKPSRELTLKVHRVGEMKN